MKKIFTLIICNILVVSLFGQAEQHRLDSIVRFSAFDGQLNNLLKYDFFYDDNGNDTLAISYSPNTTGQWENSSKTECIYNATDNAILRTTYEWDAISSQWLKYRKRERTYNSNDNQTLYIQYYWDENMAVWQNHSKYETMYDTDENKISEIDYQWDDTANNWMENQRIENIYVDGQLVENVEYIWIETTQQWIGYKEAYVYDTKGNTTITTFYDWDSDTQTWQNESKIETFYDANNNITSKLEYQWHSSQQWTEIIMSEYTYNLEGQLILFIRYLKNNDIWVTIRKIEYEYDNMGNQILIAEYDTWDEATQQWIGYNKKEFTFDSNNNRTIRIEYDWDTDNQQWQPKEKINSDFGELAVGDLIMPPYFHSVFAYFNFSNNQIYEEVYDWDESNQTWTLIRKSDYHYSSVITTVENINANQLHIFPNPTSDLVNFDLENPTSATITIHDAQGKHIGTQHLKDKQLAVGHLNSGVYFYQLLHNGEMYGGKFIVK